MGTHRYRKLRLLKPESRKFGFRTDGPGNRVNDFRA